MANEVVEVPLPASSRLNDWVEPSDFLDCYAVHAAGSPRAAANVIVAFPWWGRALLQVRKAVTAPFGLSQDGPLAPDKIGPFPVELETDNEIIAGFDDKHLNFRISVLCQAERVHLATWVRPHNPGGRLYLTVIMPFHILIARNGLKRVAQTDPYC